MGLDRVLPHREGPLTLAIIKATLVVLFFMYVTYGSRMTKLIVGVAFFFLGIMLTLTMTDFRRPRMLFR